MKILPTHLLSMGGVLLATLLGLAIPASASGAAGSAGKAQQPSSTKLPKSSVLKGSKGLSGPKGPKRSKGGKPGGKTPTFSNKPRIRREWRTLSQDMQKRVAKAYWTLKEYSTENGQHIFGPNFHNHDDMLMLHACATYDPRCDQGHYAPSFMLFHRAFLLKYELALLSVDPSIEAMPYWHMAFDAVSGKYRNNEKKYIFTDNFFGDFWGKAENNYTVTNGLYAYWPIAEYSESTYGSTSSLVNNKCIKEEYFKPETCDPEDANSPRFLRAHSDCNPYLSRNPADGINAVQLGGSYEIVYTEEDFWACTDAENVNYWMDWQNCIEISTIQCNGHARAAMPDMSKVNELVTKASAKNLNDLATGLQGILNASIAGGLPPCDDINFVGYYDTPSGKREHPTFFHSQAHVKCGLDLLDVTTSPNDPMIFTAYHADIDRSNMHWMYNTMNLEEKFWAYPATTDDTSAVGKPPFGTSGPYGIYDIAVCFNDTTYDEYDPLASPWIPGTTLDDVINAGFPFFDLFPQYSGGTDGYTAKDILYYTTPERTPYTYDTLAHLYY